MKGYKGFDKNFECNGFKYEEGKEYKHDGTIGIYSKGFHFCENPLDVLSYDKLNDSIIAEIESIGETKGDDKDSEKVTSHIKIVRRIALKEFIDSGINYIMSFIKNKTSGDSAHSATSGNYAHSATSGDSAHVELNGENNVGAAIGKGGVIKGVKGSWITLSEYDGNNICILMKSAKIDGKKIKENVWYKLENKKFVEVK
jgi:hypothetical protein